MQLTGDLSDFALTDILQILSLSRKTGVVLLDGAGWEGKIIVESGRITHASASPGKTLADSLVIAGMLGPEALRTLVAKGEGKDAQLQKLLLDSGILTPNGFASATRRHTQRVIGNLVSLEKGRFRIALGEATLPRPDEGFRLTEGLDVGEALLSAAHERDESYRTGELVPPPGSSSLLDLSGGRDTAPLKPSNGAQKPADTRRAQSTTSSADEEQDRSELLCSLLAEMKQHSFEAEVSLLLMRYASALAARGILFAVRDSSLHGLGQFGLSHRNGKTADELVRQLSFPLGADTLFERIVRTSEPYIGPVPDNYFVAELLSRFGGSSHKLTAFVLPLSCNASPAYVIYGDNYPGNYELNGLAELVALASQASLALERIALQRRVEELETHS